MKEGAAILIGIVFIVVVVGTIIVIGLGAPQDTADLIGQNQIEVCIDPVWWQPSDCYVIDLDLLKEMGQ